jgi:hypothetical protein
MTLEVSSDEVIASLRQLIGELVHENITLKLLLGKIEAGDKPQQ